MNKVLEIIPEIFYDVLARIVPGSLIITICSIFLVLQENQHPKSQLCSLLETIVQDISKISIKIIPEALIGLILIIFAYFLAIIFHSFWDSLAIGEKKITKFVVIFCKSVTFRIKWALARFW